jgi:hypothetical protein
MIFAAIRQAEPWTAGSVIAALVLLGGGLYFFWRQVRKP